VQASLAFAKNVQKPFLTSEAVAIKLLLLLSPGGNGGWIWTLELWILIFVVLPTV
jgi:hypothetical protein